MLNEFVSLSRKGEAVWIADVRAAFAADKTARPLVARLECLDGSVRDYSFALPIWSTAAERSFVLDYLTAGVFNILSCCSGRTLTLCLDTGDDELVRLAQDCLASFASVPGLRKVLNIAARLCRGMGCGAFKMQLACTGQYPPAEPLQKTFGGQLGESLRAAVQRCMSGAYCGIDVGGTDIKLAVSLDGRLLAVKEYDWNPAASPTAGGITGPVLLLARLMRACVIADGLPADCAPAGALAAALRKDADHAEMEAAAAACESAAETLPLFSGIGLSFPDVVINNRILGGETPKTKGMRENAALDYETEFGKLGDIGASLARLCAPEGRVRIINDGPMAAFSAAAELAQSGDAELGTRGVVAHSLGTDLGTGWIEAGGAIPSIPLELYDLLLDLGSEPWKKYDPSDLRSVRNENSGLAGVRRYLGQAAAYRMAQLLEPELLRGFTAERDGVISVITSPEDLRKPCLEHLMNAAAAGDEPAREIFRRIGVNLAQLTREMEHILHTGTDSRFLFGRFAKRPECFGLIKQGFASVIPDMELFAADDGLARSALMSQLRQRGGVTVAQFAQAIGAIYYSAMQEDKP